MQLDNIQKRIISGKPQSFQFVRGGLGTGKTTSLIYRAVYLKNHFCIYEEDNILIVAQNEEQLSEMKRLFETVESQNYQENVSLFSFQENKVQFVTIQELIDTYYRRTTFSHFKVLSDSEKKKEYLTECVELTAAQYKNVKFINAKYADFLLDEIRWIKSCNYMTIEAYQKSERIGRKFKKGEGPQRLLKDSEEREAIHHLMLQYNERLKEQGWIEEEDKILISLKALKEQKESKYIHILADEVQSFTKSQLELLQGLCSFKAYSNMMLTLNKEKEVSKDAWFVRGRKLRDLELGVKGKSYSLAKKYRVEQEISDNIVSDEGEQEMQRRHKLITSIENYKYIDLKYNRQFDFLRDADKAAELIVKNGTEPEEYKEDDLRELPIYNDIAAGEPIQINPEIEANFYLPQYWLKGSKDCFILKVKGDSMIGAEIQDGDYVVIRKQSTAIHREIVAVELDGSATLKRLDIQKKIIRLLPENDKYDPIPIEDDRASILGVAIGIIKNIVA